MIAALAVFVVTYVLIASEKFPRHAVALLGAGSLTVFGMFGSQDSLKDAMAFVDWETMGLLLGMFILVGILAEAGLFTWLAAEVAHRLNYRPGAIFIAFPLLAAFMAAFMDSITVMLFLSALSIRIARLTHMDPVPLVIAEVCCANTGGAATLIGNPPNVILGNLLGYSFVDFAVHTGPVAVVASLLTVGLFYLANRNMLRMAGDQLDFTQLVDMRGGAMITDRHAARLGSAGFIAAIVLLVIHVPLSRWLHIELGSAAAALMPALLVVTLGGGAIKDIVKKLDMESLLFFIGLFVLVGALEKAGFIAEIAQLTLRLSAYGTQSLLMVLLWGSGLASGVVDNIPMSLAMGYVMRDVSLLPGAPGLGIMTWALALGVDIGGNLTPVGASPNVVSYAFMERSGHHIGWGRWIRTAAVPTLAAMLVSSAAILVKHATGFF